MGYFFEMDNMNKVLRITWGGVITDKELAECVGAGRRFMALHPEIRTIADCSEVKRFDVATKTVKHVALEDTHGEEESVLVMVAPADVAFGLARMLASLTEENRPNRHVVRTMEEAYQLLGIKEPQFRRIDASECGMPSPD